MGYNKLKKIKTKFIIVLLMSIALLMFQGITQTVTFADAADTKLPNITYQTHVENIGWQKIFKNGETAGTIGKAFSIEAIAININRDSTQLTGDITYSAHLENIGWQTPVKNGTIAGTTGQKRRMEALKVNLSGELAKKYSVYYRGHVQNIGWLSWGKDGDIVGSVGYALKLEAVEIKLIDKAAQQLPTGNSYRTTPSVEYGTYVQGLGWQAPVMNGKTSGTVGQVKKIEGFKAQLKGVPYSGSIEYSTHMQDMGWIGYSQNGVEAGRVGQGRRVEAIKIRLTGEVSSYNNVYYRVHVQDRGWLGWTANDQPAGTEGYALQMEAIEVIVLPKNSIYAPSLGAKSYYNKKDEVIPITNGTPLENERAAFKFFVSLGYTREAAAGIIGNFYAESGMDPTKKQYGGGPGRGLAQWGYNMDGGRFNSLIKWARSQNRSEWALSTQLEWTVIEIRFYKMTPVLTSTHDVIYATKYFCDVFERPNPNYAHMDQRYANARIVLSRN